jgi:hypothetical protein
MTEISLVLSSPASGAAATAVALYDAGTGICAIPSSAIANLLTMRDQLVQMMGGAPRMSPDNLRQFAQTLGSILFGEDIGRTVASAIQPPLIAKIIATTKELKAIPWEYAAPPGGDPPQLTSSIVRLIPEFRANPPPPLHLNGNLRILLLSASPQNFDRIPWSDIRDRLVQVFRAALPEFEVIADAAQPRSNRYLRIVSAATPDAVRRSIRNDDPHIIHFVGHGTDKGIALIGEQASRPVLMDGGALGAAVSMARSCRLVILSACDVANPRQLDPINETISTFAEQVVRNANALPAIIASQMIINESTISTFCEGLYGELLNSGSIDVAMAAGRCNVAAQLGTTTNAPIEWGIPVLYRRLGVSHLFQNA